MFKVYGDILIVLDPTDYDTGKKIGFVLILFSNKENAIKAL